MDLKILTYHCKNAKTPHASDAMYSEIPSAYIIIFSVIPFTSSRHSTRHAWRRWPVHR